MIYYICTRANTEIPCTRGVTYEMTNNQALGILPKPIFLVVSLTGSCHRQQAFLSFYRRNLLRKSTHIATCRLAISLSLSTMTDPIFTIEDTDELDVGEREEADPAIADAPLSSTTKNENNEKMSETYTTVHLDVQGMMCQRNCGTTVANALRAVSGVLEAQADFATHSAWARVATSATINLSEILEAVEDVGFDAHLVAHLQVDGMMCQKNCGTTVANALQAVPGVLSAQAIFAQSRAIIVLEATDLDEAAFRQMAAQLAEEVEDVGFDASMIPDIDSYLQSHKAIKNDDDTTTTSTSSAHSPLMSVSTGMQPLHLEPSTTYNDNTLVLSVGGMSCAVCTGRVESCLEQVPGVVSASVILSPPQAVVELDEEMNFGNLGHHNHHDSVAQACCEAIEKAGYSCTVVEQSHDLRQDAMRLEQARKEEDDMWRRLLIFSASLLLPMILIMVGFIQIGGNAHHPNGNLWTMAILSSLVQFGTGRRYYEAAWKGWTNGRVMGMDFLIVLGTSASYVYSIVLFSVQLWTGEPTDMQPSFMTGAMLLTFVTLGKYLESYARGRTADAVHKLMELQPSVAARIREFEGPLRDLDLSAVQTEEIPIGEIGEGDYVRILPGGQIPADGELVAVSSHSSGGQKVSEAFIDESAFSGEPFPVSKRIGDSVYGSTVNQLSVLIVRVTAAGSDTMLSKIVRLVEDAQRHKAPIQAYADQLASIFAPAVVGVATITFFAWMIFNSGAETMEDRFYSAFMSALSVLLISCPCALGLATPTAVMVGTGVGAVQGILIKGGDVLEHMHTVDTVIFDKTGTLTCGKARLSDSMDYTSESKLCQKLIHNLPSFVPKEKYALWLAVCAEAQSEHPLAQAIVEAAKEAWSRDGKDDVTGASEGVRVDEFSVQPGLGVECRITKPDWGECFIRVGNREWTKANVDSIDEEISDNTGDDDVDQLRRQGKIAIYISVLDQEAACRRVISVFGIVDPVKEEAHSTISALQNHGVDVWLCTGDDSVTAHAVAQSIGIHESNVCANTKPQEKADLVTRLQKANKTSIQRRGLKSTGRGSGKVAMVADGVNDSIALARADVGIAIGAGTEIALEAADVVLVRSNLHDVVVAFDLSSVVFRRILLNFFLALCYNIVAIPFAAGLFYPLTDFHLPPAVAGFMMACSSVSVVTSSLLLKRYRRPQIQTSGLVDRTSGLLQLIVEKIGFHSRNQYVGVELRGPEIV